ncbi:MAG TPA: hypothetical protein VJ845_00540 [Haploplasma sp.]|nr:hypothetical protein [Haploplasma sp.]
MASLINYVVGSDVTVFTPQTVCALLLFGMVVEGLGVLMNGLMTFSRRI